LPGEQEEEEEKKKKEGEEGLWVVVEEESESWSSYTWCTPLQGSGAWRMRCLDSQVLAGLRGRRRRLVWHTRS
jgi:hypothetical protein